VGVSVEDKDLGYKKIKRNLKFLNNSFVEAGFPGRIDSASTVAGLAATHELGTTDGKIPSRPFMRQAFDAPKTQAGIKRRQEASLSAIYAGKSNIKRELSKLGEYFVGRIKSTILGGQFVPNAEATIKRKGSTKPLIDTGLNLLNRVTHAVVLKR